MNSRPIAIYMQDLAGGGAERVMLQLASGMAECGHRVDLVLVRSEGRYLSLIPPEVRTVELGARRTSKSISALRRYLRREQPLALLSALVHVNVAAIIAARLAGKGTRVIVTEHNQISRNANIIISPSVRLAHWMVPWIYPLATRIVAVSHGVAEDLIRFSGLPARRVDVIYNPIVTPQVLRLAAEPAHHPWFAPGQPPVILGVGRLSPQKDFANLIRAFARVRSGQPARLVILGEGAERERLERLVDELGVRSDVSLPGFVENPYALMARAGVFALSSAWEGLPTVLVEAMSCGTPVVATDCPSGPAEILQGGRLSPLVPVGDCAALANAIVKALESPTRAELLVRRADDFTVERAVDQYLRILKPAAD